MRFFRVPWSLRRGGLVALIVATAFSPSAFGQATAAKVTYKLNVAKSVYRAGQHYKSSTLTIERDGAWTLTTVEPITTDGHRFFATLRYKADGAEYPVTGSLPDGADTIISKQIDATTSERIDLRGGKEVSRVSSVRTSDGAVITVTHKGIRPDGQKFDHTIVYERQ